MLVQERGGATILRLTEDAPENFCRPAVDPMLRSVAAAAAVATVVWILYPKSRIAYVVLVFAVLVGIDRVYMGHHFPSDVLAGFVVGSLVAVFIHRTFSRFWQQNQI